MGLNIYFYDEYGGEIDVYTRLQITHNLNKLVGQLGDLTNCKMYELIWRPDELFNIENGKVPVSMVLDKLPFVLQSLHEHRDEMIKHLPDNGYGDVEWLFRFLCDYLKECYINHDKFIYACR